MNKKLLILIALSAIVIVIFINNRWHQKSTSATTTTQSLVIGTSSDYAPFSFIKEGKIVGFDIDIITQIACRLGKQLIIKDMSFDVLLLELQRGSIEVVAAGLTATPARSEKVLFTKPYLQNDPLLALTKPAYNQPIHSFADLQGKKVLVNEGYTADLQLSTDKTIVLEKVDTVAQGLLALSQGKADIYVLAQSAYLPYTKTENNHTFTSFVLEGTCENCALAISKKYPALLTEIESCIEQMVADGTIANLKTKWFCS